MNVATQTWPSTTLMKTQPAASLAVPSLPSGPSSSWQRYVRSRWAETAHSRLMLVMLCLFLYLHLPATAQGPTQETWTGATGDGLWSDGDNWSPATKPGGPNGNFNVDVPHIGGVPGPTMDVSASIVNLAIDAAAVLNITNGSQLTVTGSTIANNGALEIDANGGGTSGTLNISSNVTLTGTGQLSFDSNLASIIGGGTLINQQTINGASGGTISVALNNEGPNGQITGGPQSNPLVFTGAVTNSGTISGLGFSTVEFLNNTVQNAGGLIAGGPGQALLNGCTIIGGTVSNATAVPVAVPGGSALRSRAMSAGKNQAPTSLSHTAPSGAPTLSGVTIMGDYWVSSDLTHTNATILEGNITNNGSIIVDSPPGEQAAMLYVPGAVSLGGTGQVAVGSQNAWIAGPGTLTNMSSHTINGGGASITVADLINQSTIKGPITLAVQTLNNTGGTIDCATGVVTINGGSVQNGEIVAGSFSGVTLTGGVILSGVTLTGAPDGVVIAINAILDGLSAPDTIEIVIEIDDNGLLVLEGGVIILSPGEIFLDASQFTASLIIEESVAVNGTGQMNASNSPHNKVGGAAGKKNALTINVPTFTAGGTIGDGTFPITIGAHTTVINNGGYPLIFDVGNNLFKNLGTIEETSPSGVIQIIGKFANYNTTTNTLTGGNYIIDGTFEFDNANLVNNAAKLILAGNGQVLNQNGANGLLNFNNNTAKGLFELSDGQFFETGGTFNNEGTVIISRGSPFTIGGTSTNYNQSGTTAITTVDGSLTVPAGGLTNITGGILQASGAFNGDVSVGNASGAAATFIVGDNKKASALVSMSNNYTQLSTGAMDVQIGGTNAGTQYSQLSVTDTVKLAGTLNLAVTNKFKPVVGQTFTILNTPSGLTGTFATVNGAHINTTEHFGITDSSTNVMVDVVSGP